MSLSVRRTLVVLGILLIGACDGDPTAPDPPSETHTPPTTRALGLVEISLTGVGGQEMRASVVPVSRSVGSPDSSGARLDLVPLPPGDSGGIQLESVSTGSFTEGTRGAGGQRYLWATFRVRNANQHGVAYSDPLRNLTFLAVGTGRTIPGTPVSRLARFNGTAADSTLAVDVVPTGAIVLDDTLGAHNPYPGVLQAFTEAEAASVAAPAAVTNVFPYGFVARNPATPGSRALPANPEPDRFDGLVTFAFRVPLAATASEDAFTVNLMFLAVDDAETRLTESIEEQTPDGRAALAQLAAALGATQVTVLPGSSSTGYPGQRRVCEVRTAGSAGSATTDITAPGAFTHFEIFRPGETLDDCAADFHGGTAGRPAVGVPFSLTVRAMDRYGNVRTDVADTVKITSSTASIQPATLPEVPLAGGEGAFTVTYLDYGSWALGAVGRRRHGAIPVTVMGVTRTWTGAASTDWNTGANWDVGAAPAVLDSVVIPAGAPRYPVLDRNENIGGVTVADAATLNLGPFNLTASANVISSVSTGGITSSTGRLVLTGANNTVAGVLPRISVTGRYSMVGNVTAVGPWRVDLGRIRNSSFRLRVNN
jgi:hypothetical protein